MLRNQWAVGVPACGSRSEPQELTWKIPERTPESYFFLLLSLMDGGHPLSRQAYWVRVAALPSAPEARRKRLETAEPLTQTGPWLKTQLESLPTALGAEIVQADAAGPELQATVVVRNTGGKPAYPVRLGVWPDVYSAVWSDNYFWLDPGERVEVQARIRLDMRGIDPVSRPKVATPADLTVVVSAWNAPQQKLSVGGAGVDTKNSTPPRKGR